MNGKDVARRPWQANRAGEDRRGHSARPVDTEAADPVRHLLNLLDAALARQGAITLPDGQTVLVWPISDGCYALERRP